MNPQLNTQRSTARPSHVFATPVVHEQPRPIPNGFGSTAW
jgi:hypothetical protein